MHYSIKMSIQAILVVLFSFVSVFASDESLYSCFFNGKYTTYHKYEAKRMELLGAKCHLMSQAERVTCSMDGVRLDYSVEEAKQLLVEYPDAICDIGGTLYMSSQMMQSSGVKTTSGSTSMTIQDKLTVFFPVNSNHLSRASKEKIRNFIQRIGRSGHMFTITGYTSATGSNAHNHLLSLKRAGIVRSELLKNGVTVDSILSVDALGEESLRYNTQRELRQNRAVEIKAYR